MTTFCDRNEDMASEIASHSGSEKSKEKPIRKGDDYKSSAFDIKRYLQYWSTYALENNTLCKAILDDLHSVFQTGKTGILSVVNFYGDSLFFT